MKSGERSYRAIDCSGTFCVPSSCMQRFRYTISIVQRSWRNLWRWFVVVKHDLTNTMVHFSQDRQTGLQILAFRRVSMGPPKLIQDSRETRPVPSTYHPTLALAHYPNPTTPPDNTSHPTSVTLHARTRYPLHHPYVGAGSKGV
jgi:hypothetical protein